MKTATNWMIELPAVKNIYTSRNVDEQSIQQIQLDAIQEGMRRAAKMHELGDSVHSMEQTILIAANNLTLKDL